MELTKNKKIGLYIGLAVVLGVGFGILVFLIVRHFRNNNTHNNNCTPKCDGKTCEDNGCNGSCPCDNTCCGAGFYCDSNTKKCLVNPPDPCKDLCGKPNTAGTLCPCDNTCCGAGFYCDSNTKKCLVNPPDPSDCYKNNEDPFGIPACDSGKKLKCCDDLRFCRVESSDKTYSYKCKTKIAGDICEGDQGFIAPKCDKSIADCMTKTSQFCPTPDTDNCYNENENPFSTQGQTPCQKGINCCNRLLFCGTKNPDNSYTYTCNDKCTSPSIEVTNEMPEMPKCLVNTECQGVNSQFCHKK